MGAETSHGDGGASGDPWDGRTPVGLGVRAGRGGAVVVGVAASDTEPRVLLSTFLVTCAAGDRLSLEPYHVAAEFGRDGHGNVPAEAVAAVAEGRRRQNHAAAKALSAILGTLADAGYGPVVATLLVNRAGWVTDLLEYSASRQEHRAVAEGLAVREAVRFAFDNSGVELAEQDEKSLPGFAATTLGLSPAAIDARLKALGATAGRPWRKEQKLACLSGWAALRVRRR